MQSQDLYTWLHYYIMIKYSSFITDLTFFFILFSILSWITLHYQNIFLPTFHSSISILHIIFIYVDVGSYFWGYGAKGVKALGVKCCCLLCSTCHRSCAVLMSSSISTKWRVRKKYNVCHIFPASDLTSLLLSANDPLNCIQYPQFSFHFSVFSKNNIDTTLSI